jgi:hypothetical protein
MILLVFILILGWSFTTFANNKRIKALEAEIAARIAYDNDRNLRILWANERDACDEGGDTELFYETYGKNVSRLELDLQADLGSIERSGQGYFGFTQTQEQIQKGRKFMEDRGKRLRDIYHAKQVALQAAKNTKIAETEREYKKEIEERAEQDKRHSAFWEAIDEAPDEFSATLILNDYLIKHHPELWSVFIRYLNKANPELGEALRNRQWIEKKKAREQSQ